eukprot:m.164864 g.164864  ORF g.164864 m.164864 type:complete len:440 (+) comp18115_c0_seq20:619-1938(+)
MVNTSCTPGVILVIFMVHRGFKPMRTNMSTRVVDWGGFSGMVQFDQCIQRFNKSGWVPGVSLRGAPYDFRFPAFGFADTFFSALQNLVESMANATGGTHKVSLWAISDANGVVLAFLQRMSVPWKNRYIARWIADSPLWSGAPLAVMTYVSGFVAGAGLPYSQQQLYSALARGMPAATWRFPHLCNETGNCTDSSLWTVHDTIIQSRTKNYTAANYSALLTDLLLDAEFDMYQSRRVLDMVLTDREENLFKAPLVDTIVVAGTTMCEMLWFPRCLYRYLYAIAAWCARVRCRSQLCVVVRVRVKLLMCRAGSCVAQSTLHHTTTNLHTYTRTHTNVHVRAHTCSPTASAVFYNVSFAPGIHLDNPTHTSYTDGDGVSPLRSALRSKAWETAQKTNGKELRHVEYAGLAHATCMFPDSNAIATKCFAEMIDYITNASFHE